jgi:tellurite resistance protein TerC
MRGAMIALGATRIAACHWILSLFGVFLIVTGLKRLVLKTDQSDPHQNIIVRLTRRFFPITSRFHGQHVAVRAGAPASYEREFPGTTARPDEVVDHARPGTLMLTPLALALMVVECTDLMFAVDSIPAIFAMTADPFLVFTSHVFAILGLRSLYFALAGLLDKFRYLKVSLAVVLMVVGVKMLIAEWLKPMRGSSCNLYWLGLVLLILAAGVAGSLMAERRGESRLVRRRDSPSSTMLPGRRYESGRNSPVWRRGTIAPGRD